MVQDLFILQGDEAREEWGVAEVEEDRVRRVSDTEETRQYLKGALLLGGVRKQQCSTHALTRARKHSRVAESCPCLQLAGVRVCMYLCVCVCVFVCGHIRDMGRKDALSAYESARFVQALNLLGHKQKK